MSAVDAPGFIAAEHYRNVEDEDTVIGIYDWKSNEARVAWSQSRDPGTREQLLEVLATPMRITLAEQIDTTRRRSCSSARSKVKEGSLENLRDLVPRDATRERLGGVPPSRQRDRHQAHPPMPASRVQKLRRRTAV